MCFQPKNTANRAKDDDHRHDLLNKVFAGATKTVPDPSKLIKKKVGIRYQKRFVSNNGGGYLSPQRNFLNLS